MISLPTLALLLLRCFNLPMIDASVGDRSPKFVSCIVGCRSDYGCPMEPGAYAWTAEKCFRCRQRCVWLTVGHFARQNLTVPQFYGKWPFVPLKFRLFDVFFFVQEPASALFSLLNLAGALVMWRETRCTVPQHYRFRPLWTRHSYVAIAAWTASIIFHCADTTVTELCDYTMATALVHHTAFAAVTFAGPSALRLPNNNDVNGKELSQRVARSAFAAAALCAYAYHVRPLVTSLLSILLYQKYHHKFDYGHNLRVCVGISAFATLIYALWIVRERRRPTYRVERLRMLRSLMGVMTLCWAAAAFELLDFAPFGWVIDAHTFFHAITAPIGWLWADFARRKAALDVAEEVAGRGVVITGRRSRLLGNGLGGKPKADYKNGQFGKIRTEKLKKG